MTSIDLATTSPSERRIGHAGRFLIAATAVSALGNSMHIGAAALLVLELTRNPASVPLIAICGGFPAICLTFLVPRAIKRFGAGSVARPRRCSGLRCSVQVGDRTWWSL